MGLFFKDDPVFSVLHDVLQANILKIPDARIAPLGVIERSVLGTSKFRTTLGNILTKASDIDIDPAYLVTKPMANIAGEQTRRTDLQLGLEILGGFLKGFGVTLPNLGIHFKDVTKVTFSFENVRRIWMDNGILAAELKDQRIERNAMTSGFFDFPASKLLLIDSVIVSNDFSIHAAETVDDSFGFDVQAITEEMGGVGGKLKVESRGSHTLTFQGEDSLPFAFTCVHFRLDGEGRITGMPAFTRKIPTVMSGSSDGEWEKESLGDGFIEIEF